MWTFGAAGVWARWPRAENRHHGNHHFVRLDVYAAKILKDWNGKWVSAELLGIVPVPRLRAFE